MVSSTAHTNTNAQALFQSAGEAPGPVVVRLRGRWDDVKAVARRWHIDVEWDEAVGPPGDVCAVDGMLAVRG